MLIPAAASGSGTSGSVNTTWPPDSPSSTMRNTTRIAMTTSPATR